MSGIVSDRRRIGSDEHGHPLVGEVDEHRRFHIRFRARDGHYHWFTLKARPVLGSDGEVIRCVGTLTDVTEQKKSEERLLQDAVNDNLTGLPNRRLFLDRLETSIAVGRIEERVRPTVFVIDIDRFKQVNDGLGMSAGDTILLTLARRIIRLLKPQDTLARLGGDQFGLMPETTNGTGPFMLKSWAPDQKTMLTKNACAARPT